MALDAAFLNYWQDVLLEVGSGVKAEAVQANGKDADDGVFLHVVSGTVS